MDKDKKNISFYFDALIKSFYSKQLYEDAAQEWNSLGILYILFVTALCCVAYTIKFNRDYNNFVSAKLPGYIEEFPDIEIRDGSAQVSGKEPYIIKIDGKAFAIIDTKGTITSIDHSEAAILLTKTMLIVKGNGQKMNTIALKDVKGFKLTKQSIIELANQLKSLLIFFAYPSFIVFFLTYNLFLLFLFFPVGIIISVYQKITLPIRDILRLTALALTPSIVIKALFDFSNVQLNYVWLFYFIVAIAYISLAIHTALMLKQEQKGNL